jgi:putative transposase
LTVAERRIIVRDLVQYGCSVRRACELAQLQRATFHYQQRDASEDEVLVELTALAQHDPRSGYRRAWAVLRRTRKVNRKRVHRLWKVAQLQVKRSPRRRTRRERPARLQAAHPNHIWAYDFVQDADWHGNKLYILTVMDEFTREGLATHVMRETSAEQVEAVLAALCDVHGTPTYLRSDNGAEFVALTLQGWLARQGIQPLYIDPGCPWQNGKDERFNGTVRDECLNMQLFGSLAEARIRLEAFRQHYNSQRPHSALAYQTPLAFKQAWNEAQKKLQDSLIST